MDLSTAPPSTALDPTIRVEFEHRLRAMQQAGDIPDPPQARSCASRPATAHSASASPSTRKSPAYNRRLTTTPERRSHASRGATRSPGPAETGSRQPKPQRRQADPSHQQNRADND